MNLTEALAIGRYDVVSLVGGGGKTTALFRLCAEATQRGHSYAACGTTRINPPPDTGATVVSEADETLLLDKLRHTLARGEWRLIAGAGYSDHDRLLPVSNEVVRVLAGVYDLVAVEADGARMRPFKAPGPNEPPIPPSTTLVVAVVGTDAFGTTLDGEHTHRPERIAELTGASIGDAITPDLVATVLVHQEGGRKNVPAGARFAVVINKVTPDRLGVSQWTARLLIDAGIARVVLANVREEQPVVELVQR
jgi:probable selenium-dependent hydroxylase accessory protein YqeC